MANLGNFNAAEVDPITDFEAIPAGKYLVVATESDIKPTKAGNGNYLEVTFEIVEGEFKGRKLWSRINLDNPNPKAVQIARAERSALCRAVNILEPKDSCDLHNIPLVVTVKQKADADGEVRNEIKGYAKRETANPAVPAQAQTGTPPWGRRLS